MRNDSNLFNRQVAPLRPGKKCSPGTPLEKQNDSNLVGKAKAKPRSKPERSPESVEAKPVYSNLIGRKIAKLRYTRGWTQDTLVAKLQVLQCDITRDILANIETRRSPASSVHCFFLAKVFGVSIDELFRP